MRGVVSLPVESSDSERVWKPDVPWSWTLTPIQDEEANRKCPTWWSLWIHILNIKIHSKLGPLNFFHAMLLYEHSAINTLEFWFKNHWWSSHVCLMQLSVRWYAQLMRYLLRLSINSGTVANMLTESTKIDPWNIQHHFSAGINIPLKASEKKAKGCKNWCWKLYN